MVIQTTGAPEVTNCWYLAQWREGGSSIQPKDVNINNEAVIQFPYNNGVGMVCFITLCLF